MIMGIYYDDRFFGIRLTMDDKILYEFIYENSMTKDDRSKMYEKYIDLLMNESGNIIITAYMKKICTDVYEPTTEMVWKKIDVLELNKLNNI